MQNTTRTLHYVFASLAFLIALVTYMMTVQPTVPFWDCGEFTAAAVQQQVPHPPGAPLFLMLGKVFHLLPFGDPGWRVNLVSVFSSAFTVLLLYLITERVLKNFFKEDLNNIGNALLVYGSALVAAATFTFTDTFWFNAVESEVYAASTLFVALIAWIMMIWNEKADEPGQEKYLLAIAYVIGLSIGVHLLSILTIFSLILLIYLRKYEFTKKGLILTMLIGLATFYVVYNLVILKMPAFFAGTLPFLRSDANEYTITDSFLVTAFGVAVLAAAAFGVWWGKNRGHEVLALACSSFLLIIIGYSSYGHLLVRANSNPPMNENKPDSFEKLVSYLGREQYGEAPTWPRRYQQDERFVRHYKEHGPWSNPPTKVVTRKDGLRYTRPDYSAWKVDTKAELSYLWGYQIDHMYLRYFLWNFMGRVSDVQDAPAYGPFTSSQVVEQWNHKNGFGERFPTRFWAIPLLLGLVGLYIHFARDKRMAWVYLVLFLMTGVLAAIQQNQQNPQPRERDYFYVGSFMVWAMWVGLGVFAILERFRKNSAIMAGGVVAALAIAPLNMAWQGWGVHSRAGNYLAFDYAYNILQSVEKDAIVFTNGDNDTFPVWYLQDVAGVRRDVRIVNLSLGQTTWYVEQLKNREPFGAKKIPLSFTDQQLQVPEDDPRALSYDYGVPAEEIVIKVDPKIMAKFTNDQALIDRGTMSWTFKGSRGRQEANGTTMYFVGVQHKLVRDILVQTKFERPVYYSTSVGDPSWADEYVDLDDYLRLEGMCFRVCPAPQSSSIGEGINAEIMEKTLMQDLPFDEVHTEPHYGLKFRNLDGTTDTYYDDVNRGYMQNYRNIFYKYATYLLYDKADTARAAQVLARMNERVSLDRFPVGVAFELQMARFFETCGDEAHAKDLARRALTSAKTLIEKPYLKAWEPQMMENLVPERVAAESALLLGEWEEAKRYYQTFSRGSKADPLLNYTIDEIDIIKLQKEGNVSGALELAMQLQEKYPWNSPDQRMQQAGNELQRRIYDLRRKLGIDEPQGALSMAP
jgi:hypothetical protein